MRHWATLALTLLLAAACTAATSPGSPADETGQELEFTGTVVFVPLEGGFYGLVADDGRRYDPEHLPEPFRRDGLRVRVRGRLLPAAVGFHMWGARIVILAIGQT